MDRLAGKRALIVGAAGKDNMGQVIARRFAAEGAKVAAAGRNMANLDALAHEIDGVAVDCEFTRRDSIFAAVDAAGRLPLPPTRRSSPWRAGT